MTVLAALSVAVAAVGNVAAAFWTAIITGALGSLLGGGALEILKNVIPSLF